jgi:hypothetical protein
MSDSPNAVRDPIESFLDLIENTRYKDLPEEAVAAATVFFMDTVGVACAGRLAPGLEALIQGSQAWVGQVERGHRRGGIARSTRAGGARRQADACEVAGHHERLAVAAPHGDRGDMGGHGAKVPR